MSRQREDPPLRPSQVSPGLDWFDRAAGRVADAVARAWFFFGCVLLVVVWAPTVVLLPIDTWQLIINTVTTIITFLLVALLQNAQSRADKSVQRKLNASAEGIAALLEALDTDDHARITAELRAAVGLEQREDA